MLIVQLQSKDHIEIEVKMDELDLTAAEKKATYEEIKAYVLEHNGLKVSYLYIAQVKQNVALLSVRITTSRSLRRQSSHNARPTRKLRLSRRSNSMS